MRAYTEIGGSASYGVAQAIVVYAQNRENLMASSDWGRSFATAHAVLPNPTGKGPPILGAGRLVTTSFLEELQRGLGATVVPELMPIHVLCHTPNRTAWWTPAQVRTLFFREDSELGALYGEDLPVPPLLWRLDHRRSLYVRALGADRRPVAGDPLFHAPFWNVDDSAAVCQGSMRKPKTTSLARLGEWVDGFFGAAFTHSTAHRQTTHAGGLTKLWPRLRGRTLFPRGKLLRCRSTVLAFIQEAS